jgi:O-antigen/teichoic acid export membrane protein
MVKHFFTSSDAGLYAAIALVGRVLYFASWSVVSAMFPISAGAKPQEQNSSVLIIPLLIVASIAFFFTVFLGLFPDFVLRMLFGPGFHGHGIESLLALYASTTGAYALAVVLTAYEISRRIANVAWLQLAFSLLVVIGIALFHETLREVIVVQQVLMVLLLISVSIPFFRRHRSPGVLEAS